MGRKTNNWLLCFGGISISISKNIIEIIFSSIKKHKNNGGVMYSLINFFKRTFYLGKKRLLHIIIILTVICLNVISNSYSQWTPLSFPANAYPYAFVESGQNLFMGTGSGVYMSTDNGTTWTSRGLSSNTVYGLAVSGSNLVAGVDFWGVFTSSDNGLTWSQSSISDLSINCLFANGTYIFAGTDAAGIKRSTDNGLTWSPTALSNTSVYSLAGNNSYLFAGGASRVRRSADNGANYVISILGGASAGSVSSIVMNGSNVYAGTVNYSSPKGIYISNDNGTTWYQSTLNNKAILSLLSNGENILAGSYSNGVYLSTDAGNNWIQKNEGFTDVPSVDIMFETGNYILAGTNILSETQLVYRRLKSELFPSTAPVLISPENNSVVNTFTPVLYWGSISGATIYNLKVSTDSGFSTTVVNLTNLSDTSYSIPSNILQDSTSYYWKVSAGTGGWSDSWKFTVNIPVTPQYTIVKIDLLKDDILELLNSHIISQDNYDMLVSKLNNAIKQIQQMHYKISVNSIEQFIFEVNLLKMKNILSPEQAQTLLTQAYRIITMLNMLNGTENHSLSGTSEKKYILNQNYPNPFNPVTKIGFQIAKTSNVKLLVYDISGRMIKEIVNMQLSAGNYEYEFNGKNLSSGVYLYVLDTEYFRGVKRMVLIK